MSPTVNQPTRVTSWTNGRKAVVDLLEHPDGQKIIRKTYRRGFSRAMLREFTVAAYASWRVPITPRVVAFRPWRHEIFLEYIPGQRVLEWVLVRFGPPSLALSDFQSFHGLNPPHHVDSRVAEAFAAFRDSSADEARQLRAALAESYSTLHRIGVKHGSADPRNVLYRDGRIYIIDFDNARLCLDPTRYDRDDLAYWYGLTVK